VSILSDKRVYLRGNMIDINNGKVSRTNIKKTVDLEDITGTGFVYSSFQIWKLGVAILFVCVAIACVFMGVYFDDIIVLFYGCAVACLIPIVRMIVSYIKGRKTYFFIEYAGGCIKFDATIYALAESQDFEKQIRRAKNKVKENILNVLR
jgi:hypothetical protein